jgi:hypothetical protein
MDDGLIMAKQIHEMFPHQYADYLRRKVPMFSKEERIEGSSIRAWRTQFNSKFFVYSAASDLLQGKTPISKKLSDKSERKLKEYEDALKLVEEIRIDHAKHIWLARKAGAKINNKILAFYPEIDKWAEANGWDRLPVPTVKNTRVKHKSPRPEKDKEDVFAETFAREDKKDTW